MIRSLLISLALFISAAAQAETDWQKLLLEDGVKIDSARMSSTDYYLVRGQIESGEATSLQVKIHAEAPAVGVISRDNFVAFATVISIPIVLALGGDMEYLQEPIGTPDVEINIFMTAKGVQIETVSNLDGTKNRTTETWAKLFASEK